MDLFALGAGRSEGAKPGLRPLLKTVLGAALVLAISATAFAAETFPNKTIRIVVCTAPGGATDVTTRLVAQKLAEKLGQQVVVENRPGGDTLLGILRVKDQPADGYTVLAQSLNFLTLPLIKNEPNYQPSDFVGIGNMMTIPFLMVTGSTEPWKNLPEYLDAARKQKLTYGHGGVAGAPQLAADGFLKAYGLTETAVPYKGNGAIMPDIMANRISMFFDAYVSSGEFIRSGKMRALAVAAPARIAPLPDVPTFKELGKDFEYNVWLGLLVRKETPSDVVDRLSDALHAALDELAPRLRSEGGDPTFVTPQAFTAQLAQQYTELKALAAEGKWQKE